MPWGLPEAPSARPPWSSRVTATRGAPGPPRPCNPPGRRPARWPAPVPRRRRWRRDPQAGSSTGGAVAAVLSNGARRHLALAAESGGFRHRETGGSELAAHRAGRGEGGKGGAGATQAEPRAEHSRGATWIRCAPGQKAVQVPGVHQWQAAPLQVQQGGVDVRPPQVQGDLPPCSSRRCWPGTRPGECRSNSLATGASCSQQARARARSSRCSGNCSQDR